jgi:hypothetical protein
MLSLVYLVLLISLVYAQVLKDDCEALGEQIRLFHLEEDLYPFREVYLIEVYPREEFRKQLHQKYAQCCSSVWLDTKVIEFGIE